MSSPQHGHGPAQMKLPPPRRTLLQRLALWGEHAQALRGWVEEACGRSAAVDATSSTKRRSRSHERKA